MGTTHSPSLDDAKGSDLAVLVHGTYAARETDEGDSWWQNNSPASIQLRQRLPAGVTLPRRGELFRWSGENSERARIKAAGDLLQYLRRLEERGEGFHLIGHSHGGSVIWHALRLATLQGKPLEKLRSWTTVGTPFLHHRTRSAWNIVNLANLILAALLLRPASLVAYQLVRLILAPLLGFSNGLQDVAARVPEKVTIYNAPVRRILELMGLTVSNLNGGVQIAGFDSTRGDSVYEFLFLNPTGWLLLAVALLVIFVYINLGVMFLSPVMESLRIRAEKRLERDCMQKYRSRWLGLWSPDDEAINGLRATLDLSVSFVSRMAPRQRVLFSDHLSLLARPYYWVLAPVFNRFIHPLLDNFVRSYVIKSAQGNNRPAAEVVEVSAAPVRSRREDRHPPLPLWLNEQLVREADRHAGDIAPKLRRLLAEPSFVSGLEAFGEAISGRELVHTSYFDHAEVLDLLSLHIAWAGGERDWSSFRQTKREDLLQWFRDFKIRCGAGLDPAWRELQRRDATRHDAAPHVLAKPRRRCARRAEK